MPSPFDKINIDQNTAALKLHLLNTINTETKSFTELSTLVKKAIKILQQLEVIISVFILKQKFELSYSLIELE